MSRQRLASVSMNFIIIRKLSIYIDTNIWFKLHKIKPVILCISDCKTAGGGNTNCATCTDVGSGDTGNVVCASCDAGYALNSGDKSCVSEYWLKIN